MPCKVKSADKVNQLEDNNSQFRINQKVYNKNARTRNKVIKFIGPYK